MECWKCDKPAKGICKFCGRAVCKEHVNQMPAVITIYIGDKHMPKAIVVRDALYCGECHPLSEPVEMPEIY